MKIDSSSFDLPLDCRPVQISQVLLNLLSNALDAVENTENPWIAIEAEAIPEKQEIEIRITDSGPGIPNAVAEKMMNPFFTTKPSGKGTGLGLSISTRIMQEHGGTLRLDRSHPYTQFILRLPRHHQSS